MNSTGSRHLAIKAVCSEVQIQAVAVIAEPLRHGVVLHGLKGRRHLVLGRLEEDRLELIANYRVLLHGTELARVRGRISGVGRNLMAIVGRIKFSLHVELRRGLGVLGTQTVGLAEVVLVGIGVKERAIFLDDVILVLFTFFLKMLRLSFYILKVLYLFAAITKCFRLKIIVEALLTGPAVVRELLTPFLLLLGLDRSGSNRLDVLRGFFRVESHCNFALSLLPLSA
jgi:hypothetical protein